MCHQLDVDQCVIRAGTSRGSFASPVKLRPASTVSLFVPSRSIAASSPAFEEEDNPRGPHATPVYRFSSLIVSTMLSLRTIAPETIMVAKTIAKMPAMQARIAPQGRVKAKVLTPSNW